MILDLDISREADNVHLGLGEYLDKDRERLVGLAYLFLANAHDAEDAVQAAALRLTKVELDHVEDLPSYVRRTVINECRSWARTQVRRRSAEQQLPEREPAGDVIDALDLARALQRLSPKFRGAVVLRYYLDLDDAAIGQILGCAPATVRSRLSRALRQLRADLGGA